MPGKTVFFDKAILAMSVAVILVFIIIVMSIIYAKGYENKNLQLKNQLSNIKSLTGSVLDIKAAVQSKENKIRRRKSTGIVSTLEQVLKSLGIQARAIKPLGSTRIDEYSEENAKMEIEGTDLNSIVNLLYKIDISPLPLKLKAASVKSTFEDPDKFVCTLTVSLMSK